MERGLFTLCALLLFGGQSLLAQPGPAPQAPPPDPLHENLFEPELVMRHQRAIGLSEDQKDRIKAEILDTQTRFTELQWTLEEEMETMIALLKQDRVEEQAVLDQLDRILNVERDIKRAHFVLALRIKNTLTPDQQARLRRLARTPGRPPPPR